MTHPMTAKPARQVFTDRSRIETYQRCNRARWWEYHECQRGIVSARRPLPLAVGGSVHEGLAALLRGSDEDAAVKAALEDFSQCAGAVSLDLAEQTAIDSSDVKNLEAQLLGSLAQGQLADGQVERVEYLAKIREQSLHAFDKYLFDEQSALVEALVRAYARRRLGPLLDQFEVLEVEREGQWKLSSWISEDTARERDFVTCPEDLLPDCELWFMSRPDALLLEKESRQLYLQSFKTAASWDIRKDKDASRDMQGLSEGVAVEKRLGEAWGIIHSQRPPDLVAIDLDGLGIGQATSRLLSDLAAPPRIIGVRYEYMLKGDRWTDKDLSAELGIELRSQRSHLVRGYLNPGMTADDAQWNWSWDYLKEGGESSKLYWKSWRGTPVWKHMPIKDWIDLLDTAVETIGEESRVLGFSSKAQATGFTAQHPLDAVFIPPIVVYRNDDELRDWIEQVEAQEVRIAQGVEIVKAARDDGEKRHLLNIYFPQTRWACEYPTTCQFSALCWGGDDARRDPLGTGRYRERQANHLVEFAIADTA